MNVSKKDLLKDMEKASEFDQSALFKKIYEEEFGMFGGAPYGALIGDYEFSNHPQDLALLEKISQVAAAAHAPFISGSIRQDVQLGQLHRARRSRATWPRSSQSVDYAKWKSFRESEDSRYVALALPHMLMRLPYGQANVPVEAFNFEEEVDGTDHSKYLWGNAAYALGARLTDAFAKYHWCAAIRGVEGGGLVAGSAGPYLQDRRGRRGAEMPHRDRHHRPAGKRVCRPGLHSPGPLQGHRLCGILQHPDGQQAQGVRLRCGQLPMRGFPRSCSTSWPYPGLPIT